MTKKQEPFPAVFVKAIDLMNEKNASAKTAQVKTLTPYDVDQQEPQVNNDK